MQATSDVQALGLSVLQFEITLMPLATILKLVVFNSYGFTITFLIIELWKLGFVFGVGLINSLGILQLCFILEFE